MARWIIQCLLCVYMILTSNSAYKCNYHAGYHEHDDHHEHFYDDISYEDNAPQQNRRVDNIQPQQRGVNLRSLPTSSGVQRIQEQERRRLEPRVADPSPRIENGSYKIVNFNKHNLQNRRVQPEDLKPKVREGVVFPGPATDRFIPVNIPEKCKKEGICESVQDYPEEHVEKLLAKLGDIKNRFKIDELEMPDLAQRIGSDQEETELCESSERVALPQVAPDINGEWHYIVNPSKAPLQGVRIEICSPNKACSNIASFRNGYVATCKQKYSLRVMTAVGKDSLIDRSFRLPSCCSCVVKPADYDL